eukprot:6210280-Pleurochrysis_carterae.AAC.1
MHMQTNSINFVVAPPTWLFNTQLGGPKHRQNQRHADRHYVGTRIRFRVRVYAQALAHAPCGCANRSAFCHYCWEPREVFMLYFRWAKNFVHMNNR